MPVAGSAGQGRDGSVPQAALGLTGVTCPGEELRAPANHAGPARRLLGQTPSGSGSLGSLRGVAAGQEGDCASA